jgi:hypothetical protein
MPFVLVATVLALVVAATVVGVALLIFAGGCSLAPFRNRTSENCIEAKSGEFSEDRMPVEYAPR